MSFEMFENDSFCFGRRHRSSTRLIYGDVTSERSKVLIGFCSICNRKKAVTVSDKVQSDDLDGFLKILRKVSARAGNISATNVLKNPGRTLEVTSIFASAAATKKTKAALSLLPQVINFNH